MNNCTVSISHQNEWIDLIGAQQKHCGISFEGAILPPIGIRPGDFDKSTEFCILVGFVSVREAIFIACNEISCSWANISFT